MRPVDDKIKNNDEFNRFLLLHEIFYLLMFTGLILLIFYPTSSLLICSALFSFFTMLAVFLVYFVRSFFYMEIKILRKKIIKVFLFRLSVIFLLSFFLLRLIITGGA